MTVHDVVGRSCCPSSCASKNHQEGHHLEVVDAGELALHGVRAARREQAGHGALLVLADDRGDGRGEQVLGAAHVLALLGRPVEAGTGAGVGQVAPKTQPLQPVENLLGLGVRQQHRAVVADVDEVVRRERIARLDGALQPPSPSARRQKMTPGANRRPRWWW